MRCAPLRCTIHPARMTKTFRSFAVAAFTASAALLAQVPTSPPPAAPAVPAAPALPAAGSAEAAALVDKAIAKMQAYGRGKFTTRHATDAAMLRGQGLPFGDEETEVKGGWHRDLVWGDHEGAQFLRGNGRMLAKVDGGWKLRASKLAGGATAPFALDPELLLAALGELPGDVRKAAHVEAGEIGGKPVAIVSLQLDGAVARDFAESGAVPGGGGAPLLMFGGGGMDVPENEYAAFVALFVDAASGDLLRLAAKVYETNAMMGRVQIQVAGAGADGDDAEDADADDAKDADKAGGALQWKKGLPVKKPAKDESVTSYRVDFAELGLAEPPAVDAKAKALLRLR
jgi:hypothetical protein